MSGFLRASSAPRGPFPALTPREAAVLEAIGALRAEGVTPTCARVGGVVGRAPGSVFAPVLSLVEKGFLTRGRSARSIRVTPLGEAFLPPAFSCWDWNERAAS